MSTYLKLYDPKKRYDDLEVKMYFQFSFALDSFQKIGCYAIERNENVLACAHTGSGKTVLALYTIARCLFQGHRVIYISPIKTLSNQKYKEFKDYFKDVGILTGDIKLNPDAKCVIMTAEILRNYLFSSAQNILFNLDQVSSIILDEVHYINNKDRGRVWEEILLFLPPNIQLVLLSATLYCPEHFGQWIGELRKIDCHVVKTNTRPVPLKHFLYWDRSLHMILDEWEVFSPYIWDQKYKEIQKHYQFHRWSNHLLIECLMFLQKEEMLPVTIFLLNKNAVEKTALSLPQFHQDHTIVREIEKIWHHHMFRHEKNFEKTYQWNLVKPLLLKGIGIHHSGMIPIIKEIIEILYSKGLLPVLLATETFAMGINAPTKTVLFTSLQKFDGNQHRSFLPEEYHQMAGRAGRRGLDPEGTVIILPHRYMPKESEIRRIILSSPSSVQSKLVFDYHLILQNIDPIHSFSESLFYRQKIVPLVKEKIKKKQAPLNFDREKMKNIVDLENQLLPKDFFIKLSKKQEKEIKKKLNEARKEYQEHLLPEHKIYYNYLVELDQEYNQSESWKEQISILKSFLFDLDIIDGKGQLTENGIIMKEIHDANPILVTKLLQSDIFCDLSPPSIISIFSMFVVDFEKDPDILLWSDLSLSLEEKICIDKIIVLIQNLEKKELEYSHRLPFPFTSNWKFSKLYFTDIKLWYQGFSYQHLNRQEDFEGNFIKNILRVTNFLQSLYSISCMIQNIHFMKCFQNIQEKMIRDIVISDSLYVVN